MSARCVYGDPLLDEIEELRYSTKVEDSRRLVTLAVDATRCGIYPSNRPDLLAMIRSYGPCWFEFREPHTCPACGISLHSPHGPPFKREIGLYCRDRDRTVAYLCPDCSHEWPRQPETPISPSP